MVSNLIKNILILPSLRLWLFTGTLRHIPTEIQSSELRIFLMEVGVEVSYNSSESALDVARELSSYSLMLS